MYRRLSNGHFYVLTSGKKFRYNIYLLRSKRSASKQCLFYLFFFGGRKRTNPSFGLVFFSAWVCCSWPATPFRYWVHWCATVVFTLFFYWFRLFAIQIGTASGALSGRAEKTFNNEMLPGCGRRPYGIFRENECSVLKNDKKRFSRYWPHPF